MSTLIHDAMIYRSDDQFVTALVPFAHRGLEQNEAVIAAVTRTNIDLLHEALGADASAVSFIDRDEWYQRPATTVAGWRKLLSEATGRGHRRVRLIGEVGFGAGPRHATWTRYEAALNDVFASAPASIVCPYDARVLPDALLAHAWRTHPMNDDYLPPEQYLAIVPEPMPPVSGPPALDLEISGEVAPARRAVSALLSAAGWSGRDGVDDLLVVMTELVTNSIRYGRGRRELRVWLGSGTVTCEVSDDGNGPSDPLSGYRPPDPNLTGGRGLWIAQQLCDALAISRDGTRTVVRCAVPLAETTS